MAKKRLIPKLQLVKNSNNRFTLVVTKNFKSIFEIGDPVSLAKIYQSQGADELIFVNIDRLNKSINNLSEVIKKVSEQIFMPITVGGGVNSLKDFRILLNSGADKICINSNAIKNPGLIASSAAKFGAQCVVVSIDYKFINGKYNVFIDNGSTNTEKNLLEWAIECERLGAGEILLTSIDNDGEGKGLELIKSKEIISKLSIPLVLSGGCGLAEHFIEGYKSSGADAVSAGNFFVRRDQNFMQTRAHISNAGIDIRIHT
tara:strand:- start:247 stop:1023 length:777 start_codon:yes stop_codon:yes gene_type:complete